MEHREKKSFWYASAHPRHRDKDIFNQLQYYKETQQQQQKRKKNTTNKEIKKALSVDCDRCVAQPME